MTTYQNIHRWLTEDTYATATPRGEVLAQIAVSVATLAPHIISEDTETLGHTQRAALAVRVVQDRMAVAVQFLPLLVTMSTAALWPYLEQGGALADADVYSGVSGLWNTVAGVMG